MPRYVGWALDDEDRERLLKDFPPAYPQVVADHVTLSYGPAALKAWPPKANRGEVVGQTDDGAGVQALVVRIDGTTERPDGSTYHLTWSLGPGRKGVESNDVLARKGWEPVEPRPIRLIPRAWP